MTTNADKLARTQKWLGQKTIGVYNGVYTEGWTLVQFEQEAITYRNMGVDYAIVKFGEGGEEWYGGSPQWAAIKAVYYKHGVGIAPFWFNRPNFVNQDIQSCVKLANIFGGIILDTEDPFFGQSGALHAFINGIRAQTQAVIGVTGYGDPTTAAGYSFDFSALANADFYNPEWYIGSLPPHILSRMPAGKLPMDR